MIKLSKNQKETKAEALKIVKAQSRALTKFVNDNDILLTFNQGVLEIHSFALDENNIKIYNHIIHKLPSRFNRKRMTLKMKAQKAGAAAQKLNIGSGTRNKMYETLVK